MTFGHPPINMSTATTVAELSDLAGLIEQDPDLNVVVFDSANRDFYLAIMTWKTTPPGLRHSGSVPLDCRHGSTSLSVWWSRTLVYSTARGDLGP